VGSTGFNQTFSFSQSCGFGNAFSYSSEIISNDSLVLFYDVKDIASYPGAGTAIYDLQGNSNGTLINTPVYSNSVITFNGVNQRLVTDTSLGPKVPGEITSLSLWAYPMDNGVLLSELGQPTLETGFHNAVMDMVAGVMKFGTWSQAGITSVASNIPTPLNAWYNFVMVYNGTKLITYVNGVAAGSVTYQRVNPIESGKGLYYAIAAGDSTNMGDGTYTNMKLGEFRVYNIALTPSQVLGSFTATRKKYGV